MAGIPPIAGLSHIDLTVTDVSVSRAFYAEVLGFAQKDVTTTSAFTGVVLSRDDLPFTIGLNWCEAADGSAFDEMRTGMDHLPFLVPTRVHLEAWQERLRDHGVVFTPIVHVGSGDVLVFRDPDNIQLEFFPIIRGLTPSPGAAFADTPLGVVLRVRHRQLRRTTALGAPRRRSTTARP